MDNRYNHRNRRKYSLKVHIVLVTKYRKRLLNWNITDDVKQKIYDITNSRDQEIIAMETDKDHIHFLLSYDTTDRVSDIVATIKQQTTYYLWQKIRDSLIQTVLEEENFLVRRILCMQYRRSVLCYNTKVYRNPRITKKRCSSHPLKGVGFRTE